MRHVPRQQELFKVEVECPIVREVIDTLINRAEEGMVKYGVTLERTDLTTKDWINHALEEALDFACYLTRLKRDLIKESRSNTK